MRVRDPLTGAKAKASKPALSAREKKRLHKLLHFPNVTAACEDGCLDRLVASVRKNRGRALKVVAGALAFNGHSSSGGAGSSLWPPTRPAAPLAQPPVGEPLLLLGLLSGSQPRREMLRCSWMRVPALRSGGVRILFIVGKDNAENRPDVLAVDVKEGAFMRSKNDKANQTRSFDVKKLIRTGSVTTYWKLVEWLKYAARQPEPMIARADDDVFISPRMLIAQARLLLHARGYACRLLHNARARAEK